ncbi:MAG: flagellar motor protein MotB [Elusimicrobia bacterium]|nr:flagellar motor protein MotB [Elusimicrobiota bacterium]
MPLKSRNMIDEDDPRVSQIGHPAPAWLVNYADLMTELVCFFVILYALSAALNKDIQKAKTQVEDVMKNEKISGEAKVDKEGLRISLSEQGQLAFFESGRADITPRMGEILGKLAPSLVNLTDKNDIIVEGHTDNIPVHSGAFASNWELSTARATQVVRFLVNQKRFPPSKMAAIGYGEYRPIAPNNTPDNRAKNRRVVFFVKNLPALSPSKSEK